MIERHGEIFVVRDDLRPGGAKTRFIGHVVPDGATELVFGAPFCGGAPVALAVEGQRRGIQVTIFYAERNVLAPRQQRVRSLGAQLKEVRPGYMTVVQARARAYAQERGATFFPLGFDMPAAQDPFVTSLREEAGNNAFAEIWCATGSGMLARCLGLAFPHAKIRAVAVGLKSRWEHQTFPANVEITVAAEKFEQKSKARAPFQCCGHYDLKAWAACDRSGAPGALFWCVMGDD